MSRFDLGERFDSHKWRHGINGRTRSYHWMELQQTTRRLALGSHFVCAILGILHVASLVSYRGRLDGNGTGCHGLLVNSVSAGTVNIWTSRQLYQEILRQEYTG
jgi:hypothetical protein